MWFEQREREGVLSMVSSGDTEREGRAPVGPVGLGPFLTVPYCLPVCA